MQILSLIIAAFFFVCLIALAITRNAGDSINPLVGGAWATFVFSVLI